MVRDAVIEESAAGQPTFINKHHTESIFNRYKLLREKAILTDAVIVCKNGDRYLSQPFLDVLSIA